MWYMSLISRKPQRYTHFPYTTLFRSIGGSLILQDGAHKVVAADLNGMTFQSGSIFTTAAGFNGNPFGAGTEDRKSTRLNSSHVENSYAGFCLKKKRNNNEHHVD